MFVCRFSFGPAPARTDEKVDGPEKEKIEKEFQSLFFLLQAYGNRKLSVQIPAKPSGFAAFHFLIAAKH